MAIPMRLTGQQLHDLQQALFSAFPRRIELEQFVRIHLNESLDAIAAEDSLSATVFRLIQWAEARGRLSELVRAARTANPNNPELARFVALIGESTDVKTQSAPPSTVTTTELPDPTSVRRVLVENYSLEELRDLCFDLRVDYDSLPGEGKSAKARELVGYFQRRSGLGPLVAAIRAGRGNIL